ncbi:MAG: DNA mismatch repair endonuclease MutL [Emergencia sp.]
MIKVLEKNIADKIAAGEVIERPVSIVKELVENAIDAGARSITTEIKNGGKSLIRVTDDGCGIEKDQAETAFLRHATSKIASMQDLNAIGTLGFRGEALASIAAVTRTELITKVRTEKLGTRLLIHGGEVLTKEGTGCPDGTTIIVSDLFYNTPARRKFMKSDSAESARIIDFMSQIALAYPDIRFRFINSGNVVFSTTGKGDVLAAILSVYKLKEYQNLVPVDFSRNGTSVTGYISGPALSRTSRRSQIFFVNGRVVSSRVIEKGVSDGYRERLFEGRYPVAFLFLQTDPSRLDVNIHPNKKEIRFDNEAEITDLVAEAVRQALGTKAAVPEIRDTGRIFRREDPVKAEIPGASQREEQVDIKQILSSKKRDIPQQTSFRGESISRTGEGELPTDIPQQPSMVREKETEYKSSPAEAGAPVISLESPAAVPFDFEDLTVTGTIFDTYITAVDGESFYLIDQHAAHERVFYEKLVGEYLAEEKLRQPVLTPLIIEVPLTVKENEYDWLDSLRDMGFSIENFGQNSYIIREIPTFMDLSEAEDFVRTYIDSISDGTRIANTVVISKLITRSCKSAVKAHDRLSMEEIRALMKQLAACRNPFSCPHGRPTFIRMSKYEIEKMFKRV